MFPCFSFILFFWTASEFHDMRGALSSWCAWTDLELHCKTAAGHWSLEEPREYSESNRVELCGIQQFFQAVESTESKWIKAHWVEHAEALELNPDSGKAATTQWRLIHFTQQTPAKTLRRVLSCSFMFFSCFPNPAVLIHSQSQSHKARPTKPGRGQMRSWSTGQQLMLIFRRSSERTGTRGNKVTYGDIPFSESLVQSADFDFAWTRTQIVKFVKL